MKESSHNLEYMLLLRKLKPPVKIPSTLIGDNTSDLGLIN